MCVKRERKMIVAIGKMFASIMGICYKIVPSYGWCIVFFTFVAKALQLPIAIMLQYNSIKMVKMYPEMNLVKAKYYGSNDLISEENYKLYKEHDYHPMYSLIPVVIQLIVLMGVVEGLRAFNVVDKMFLGINLGDVPSKVGGINILIPIVAALAAWLMCFAQNISNVLQSEQNKVNQAVTMIISVGLSLYLGFFVEGGVGLYWIAGNLLSIVQMYALNFFINPKKHIDYEALQASKEELEKVQKTISSQKKSLSSEELAKEKADYKRFMKYGTKQLVFYSEKNGFYKYYADIIDFILARTDITIHYISGDINDEIFSKSSDQFRTYYISENKLIILMMKMDADVVVLTMPDLQKYHIKRSMVRHDIEYLFIPHAIGSSNMLFRKHALDYFDTVFVPHEIYYNELRAQEKMYGLKEKNLIKYGFCLIDNMIKTYESEEHKKTEKPTVLIAPSWQPDNLIEICLDELLQSLLNGKYNVIVRPHPQYVRHYPEQLEDLRKKYAYSSDFELQTDFSSNSTVFNADVLLTDWSGIAYEYSMTTLKPSLFVNTPMKVMNPDYEEIGIVPFDIEVRSQMGISIETNEASKVSDIVERLLSEPDFKPEAMLEIREKYLYNVGNSAEVGARYIIRSLIEKSKQ